MFDDQTIRTVSEFGAIGLVLVSGYMVMRWMLARAMQQDQFLYENVSRAIKAIRDDIAESYKEVDREYRAVRQELIVQDRALRAITVLLIEIHNTLTTHDMRIRGINPGAGQDEDERITLALEQLEQWQKQQHALKETILSILDRDSV